MILINVQIGNMITITQTVNGKISNNVVPPDVLKICKRISLEGVFDPKNKVYYPPRVIERIDIGELGAKIK